MVDCQKDSLDIDYRAPENAVTENTKAIISIELDGIPYDYDRIFETVERKRNMFRSKSNTELGQRTQKDLGRITVIAEQLTR